MNERMRKARQLLASAVIAATTVLDAAALPAVAQQAPATNPVEDANALVRRMEERLRSLDKAAKERDEALGFLSRQVEAAQGAIDGGGQAEAALRQGAAALSTRLDEVAKDRERLSSDSASDSQTIEDLHRQLTALNEALDSERKVRASTVGEAAGLRDQLAAAAGREKELSADVVQKERALADLQQKLAALETSLGSERSGRADAQGQIAALQGQLEAGAKREQGLIQSMAERDRLVTELQGRLAALGSSLDEERTARTEAQQQLAALSARIEAGGKREHELGQSLADKETALAELGRQVAALGEALGVERSGREKAAADLAAAEQRLAAGAAREKDLAGRVDEQERTASGLRQEAEAKAADIARLADEVAGLRAELERTRDLLGGEREVSQQRQTEIASLSGQLKAALESQIQELSQYRSEFFGRLRQALGDRSDVRIVGDRFVFQAEVLFASGSAWLGEAGQEQLRQLARTLQDVAATIPPDVNWILRVDGHTDRIPINNAVFASNWQLSSARAIAVVEFLVRQGIPPERLAAAGFGEFQPLETTDDEIAYRRNRRIEFKLTER